MATKSKVSSFLELTPEELAEIDKESKHSYTEIPPIAVSLFLYPVLPVCTKRIKIIL